LTLYRWIHSEKLWNKFLTKKDF